MRTEQFTWKGLSLIFGIDGEGFCRLVYLGEAKNSPEIGEETAYRWHRPVELHLSGENQDDAHFSKLTGSSEGGSLRFEGFESADNEFGREITLTQKNQRFRVRTRYQFFSASKTVRIFSEAENIADRAYCVEYITGAALMGILGSGESDWQEETDVLLPHNCWGGEFAWKRYSVKDLGLYHVGSCSGKRIALSCTGGWTTHEYLPMGAAVRRSDNQTLLWQIEPLGSWNWEISTKEDRLYLMAAGPTAGGNGWYKTLAPGESLTSAPCALCFADGVNAAFCEITKYRRAIRRKNPDNERLPVIFNDYMNCLFGDPTTEKELPMIDCAAEIGCEYYCIDAGWYDDGDWWSKVGEWLPAKRRFPGGLKSLIDYIKSKGMTPGLWLEIEVMGIDSELAKSLPDDYFFLRNGRRVIDHGRYQLNFANPEAARFADGVVKRLVEEYGVGYIKMDYNINCGIGTEWKGSSPGEGLTEHRRRYLAWVESLFRRYPGLVVENCGSGGMRMDYSMLRLHSIQSTSDQEDYRKYAAIAANCASGVTPEQAAVWSYPLEGGDCEETAFNMVNALLFRIHQSGHICRMSGERLELVKQGIALYKNLRRDIAGSLPVFLGEFGYFDSPFCAYGAYCGKNLYVAVWNLNNDGEIVVDLPCTFTDSELIYPTGLRTDWQAEGKRLVWRPSQRYQARLFKLAEVGEIAYRF